MEAWYSGLMPYEYLLPSQIALIAVMAKICIDFTRERGYFYEAWNAERFAEHGLPTTFVQGNVSASARGVLRGLHFQYPPHAETKLMRAIRGAILDIIVDLRPESDSYLEHAAVELSADNYRALYVPERFAHGYQALEDGTVTSYQVGEFYAPGTESGLSPFDPRLGLNWPLPVSVISPKDAGWRHLEEVGDEVKRRMAPARRVAAEAPQ